MTKKYHLMMTQAMAQTCLLYSKCPNQPNTKGWTTSLYVGHYTYESIDNIGWVWSSYKWRLLLLFLIRIQDFIWFQACD